jgi:hypothetical protein
MILMGLNPDVTHWMRTFDSQKFTRQDYQMVWRNADGRFDRYLRHSRDALTEMKKICDSKEIPILLLYHAGLPTPSEAERIAETHVMRWCGELEIPCWSYTDRYRESGGFEQYAVSSSDGHPNAAGHRKIAEWLLEDLSGLGLLPLAPNTFGDQRRVIR